jgi:hypothetical protein
LPGSSSSIPSLFWPFFASHEGPRTRRERDCSRPGFLAQLHHAPFSRENGLLTAASPAQSVGHIPKTKAGGGSKDKNGTKIFRTEPHRFLYFIRLNSYFCV